MSKITNCSIEVDDDGRVFIIKREGDRSVAVDLLLDEHAVASLQTSIAILTTEWDRGAV